MSRGLGKLQRSLLAELERLEHASAQDLAEQVFGQWPPTDSQYSACRRALQALRRRGLVRELPIRYRHEWIDAQASAQKHYAIASNAERLVRRDIDGLKAVVAERMGLSVADRFNGTD